MKLDATDLRYLTNEEFRILTAVEMGSKNHEVVPNPLIAQISGLRSGGVNKLLGSLAKRNLIAKVRNSKYDGYRLTYGGYDYLAMRTLSKRGSMHSVGTQIGVGKESDIYVVADAEGNQMVLKLHRLGRISFRAIKAKRDYMGKRKSASWMYMSRLAAQKEWAFMKALHEHAFPVPRPIDQARHCILMEFIDAFPLRQVSEVPSPGRLYSSLMDLIVRFAESGLIHGDFNEFNILIRRDSGDPVVIDFPQMVSTRHENAEWYFNRDVECIRAFFRRRFQYESALYPKFQSTFQTDGTQHGDGFRLDVAVSASGFARKDMKILEDYIDALKIRDDNSEVESGVKDGDGDGKYEAEEAGQDGDEESEDGDSDEEEGGDEDSDEGGDDGVGNEGGDDGEDDDGDVATDIMEPGVGEGHRDTHAKPGIESKQSEGKTSTDHHPLSQPLETRTSIRRKVVNDISGQRAKQHSKYNSKRSTRRVGRPTGSKAKQDGNVRLDKSGVWE